MSVSETEVVPTIQEVIGRGWITCPKCQTRCIVDSKGKVTGCDCYAYWNVFVQVGEEP